MFAKLYILGYPMILNLTFKKRAVLDEMEMHVWQLYYLVEHIILLTNKLKSMYPIQMNAVGSYFIFKDMDYCQHCDMGIKCVCCDVCAKACSYGSKLNPAR